jgi:hypothetical protein
MRKALYLTTIAVGLLFMMGRARAASPVPFVFFNEHTGMCLGPQNDSTAQGAPIVQVPCKADGALQWIYLSAGNGAYQLQNALTGLCLDARGGAANHTPVQQWTCDGITNEKWKVVSPAKGSNSAPLQSEVAGSSSFCLDVPGGQVTVGLPMQIYGCNQTVSQLWNLKSASAVFVPNVSNTANTSTLNAAAIKLTLYGFTVKQTNIASCFAGHTGFIQSPNGGTFAPPNSEVTLTVYTCTKPK